MAGNSGIQEEQLGHDGPLQGEMAFLVGVSFEIFYSQAGEVGGRWKRKTVF